MNTEYKTLARIRTNPLLLVSTLECQARVDDGTGHYTVCRFDIHSLISNLSLHFTAAFDRISHTYLLRILKIMTIA